MKKLMDKFGKKKLLMAGVLLVIVIAAIIGAIVWFLMSRGEGGRTGRGIPQIPGMGEEVISASGLTTTGMIEEKYELDFLETALYVEEAYLSVGDVVEVGTAVFKVSDETLAEARDELEKVATEADLAYRQGVIDYETQRLEAESTLEQAEINKEYAQAEYDSALQQAKQEVESLKKQVEEAQELYNEYKAAVESNYYYTYYNVEELKQVYYDNFSYLMKLYDEWNIEELREKYPNSSSSTMSEGMSGRSSDSTSNSSDSGNASGNESGNNPGNGEEFAVMQMSAQVSVENSDANKVVYTLQVEDSMESSADSGEMSGGSMMGGRVSGSMSGGSFYNEESSKLSVYEMLDELVQKNGDEYETALENYERNTKTATASLESARSELVTLQAELEEAKLEYEKQVIAVKADYETTIAESENAESVYDTEIKKLDEELEALMDEKEESKENLTLFEDTIGDGYFYTQSAGTVMMNMVRAGNFLSGESMLIAYSNPETVTVAASVGQADIAQIAVGDNAYVMINEYGDYEGTVVSIDPVSSSGSRSSVTYTVTVELSGDVEALESNLTAYVYFGMQLDGEGMSEDGMQPAGERMSEGGMQPGGERMSEGGMQPGGERMPEGGMQSGGEGMPKNGTKPSKEGVFIESDVMSQSDTESGGNVKQEVSAQETDGKPEEIKKDE